MMNWNDSVMNWNALNESPSEKEGKFASTQAGGSKKWPSMKVPPKRKGNSCCRGGSAKSQSPQ